MNSVFRPFFLLLILTISVKSEDPYEMFSSVIQTTTTETTRKPPELSTKATEESCPQSFMNEYRTVSVAYRLVIRDWLKKIPSKNDGSFKFTFDLTAGEIKQLENFATGDSNGEVEKNPRNLKEVQTISELLQRTLQNVVEQKQEYIEVNPRDFLQQFDFKILLKWLMFGSSVIGISFFIMRAHLRRGRWLTTIFISFFLLSVAQNWYTLYVDAQAKVDQVLMKKLPEHCQGQSMSILQNIKSYFGRFVQLPDDECLNYHRALRTTAHFQVTPVQAISMTFAQLFVTPLGVIGESLSQFFAGTLKHVPILLWPLIIGIIVIVFIVLSLMFHRYEIHLPFMMGAIRPAANPVQNPRDQERIETLQDRIQQLEDQLQQAQNALPLENSNRRPSPPGFRPEVTE